MPSHSPWHTWLRPFDLAIYKFLSAFFMNRSIEFMSPELSITPIDTVICNDLFSNGTTRASTELLIRSAIKKALFFSVLGNKSANSSPPILANMS